MIMSVNIFFSGINVGAVLMYWMRHAVVLMIQAQHVGAVSEVHSRPHLLRSSQRLDPPLWVIQARDLVRQFNSGLYQSGCSGNIREGWSHNRSMVAIFAFRRPSWTVTVLFVPKWRVWASCWYGRIPNSCGRCDRGLWCHILLSLLTGPQWSEDSPWLSFRGWYDEKLSAWFARFKVIVSSSSDLLVRYFCDFLLDRSVLLCVASVVPSVSCRLLGFICWGLFDTLRKNLVDTGASCDARRNPLNNGHSAWWVEYMSTLLIGKARSRPVLIFF